MSQFEKISVTAMKLSFGRVFSWRCCLALRPTAAFLSDAFTAGLGSEGLVAQGQSLQSLPCCQMRSQLAWAQRAWWSRVKACSRCHAVRCIHSWLGLRGLGGPGSKPAAAAMLSDAFTTGLGSEDLVAQKTLHGLILLKEGVTLREVLKEGGILSEGQGGA
eukprot:gene1936-33346_t